MSAASGGSEPWVGRANDLYWSSSQTVEEIVEELGVSRGSFYQAIEPQPTGLVCGDCGERMVFLNRTARDRGNAICPECGRESEPGEADRVAARREEAAIGEEGRIGRWRLDLAAVPAERVVMVGGAAALGVFVGAMAARAVRDH